MQTMSTMATSTSLDRPLKYTSDPTSVPSPIAENTIPSPKPNTMNGLSRLVYAIFARMVRSRTSMNVYAMLTSAVRTGQ